MFTFDRPVFYRDLPGRTGIIAQGPKKAGLDFLLDQFEADSDFTQVRDLAYVLATIRWETGQAFQPVKEKRASRDKNPRLWEVQNRYWPSGYYGRGYVQITLEANYRGVGEHLAGSDFMLDSGDFTVTPDTFVQNPGLVLTPVISYAIAARGMREGWFTSKKLSDFIRDGKPPDYVGARKIINGVDQADRIAEYANAFELVLRAASTNQA